MTRPADQDFPGEPNASPHILKAIGLLRGTAQNAESPHELIVDIFFAEIA